MASGVKTLWETGDMDTVLAKLQGSGSIYFHKLLGRSHNCKAGRIMQLVCSELQLIASDYCDVQALFAYSVDLLMLI